MPEEQGNALGRYLREKREAAGLSIRAAARKAKFSEGRWRQLERGYQSSGGDRIPANPRPVTVVQAADALEADAEEALRVAGLVADVDEVRREIEQGPESDLPTPTLATVASEAVASGTLQRAVLALIDLLTSDEIGKVKLGIGLVEMRANRNKAELQKEGLIDPEQLRDPDYVAPVGNQEEVLNTWADLANARHFYSVAYARADLAQQRKAQLQRLLRIDDSPANEALCRAAEKTLKDALAEAREVLKQFQQAEESYDKAVANNQGGE